MASVFVRRLTGLTTSVTGVRASERDREHTSAAMALFIRENG